MQTESIIICYFKGITYLENKTITKSYPKMYEKSYYLLPISTAKWLIIKLNILSKKNEQPFKTSD